jgi:hypothetical protein
VRPVRRTKSVVYKYIAQRSQIFGEGFAVLGLFDSVTGILQKDHVAVRHCVYGSLHAVVYHNIAWHKLHFFIKQLGQPLSYRRKRKLRLWLSLWLA